MGQGGTSIPLQRPSGKAEERTSSKEGLGLFLPIVAGWIVPGLGHGLLGRRGRALIFGALIWGCYGMGLAHDGSLALRDRKQPFLTTLQVVANLGMGPVDAVARTAVYGRPTYTLATRTARQEEITQIYRKRIRSDLSIYGTAYLWTAGLLNLLLLFDIWDIGRGRKP